MKRLHILRLGWILALAVLVLGVAFMSPALAANHAMQHTSQTPGQANSSSLNAIVYLTTGSLASTFQNRIDQQIPGAVNAAISNTVSSLPAKDQGWATEMATTLIQPSAALESLYPQSGGLAMKLRLSLYPGDPQAITSSMLNQIQRAQFVYGTGKRISHERKSIACQRSSNHLPHATRLVKFHILNPWLRQFALALNLQFPVALGQASSQVQPLTSNVSTTAYKQPVTGSGNAFIEVPATSYPHWVVVLALCLSAAASLPRTYASSFKGAIFISFLIFTGAASILVLLIPQWLLGQRVETWCYTY